MPGRLVFLLLCGVAGAFCARLGVWQLGRLAERRAANEVVRAGLADAVADVGTLPDTGKRAAYRRVRASGVFDYTRELALAPRSRQGSPGVHIVTPLRRTGTDTLLLVVRGWVYAPDARTVDFSRWRERDTVHVEGYTLAVDSATPAPAFPESGRVVRRLVRPRLEARLGAPVAGYYLVATSPAEPAVAAPVRLAEPALNDGPHLSYAVQWFLFACVFIAGGTVVALRGRTRKLATGGAP